MRQSGKAGMPVAILAGGLATRLRPLTESVPKVLLEVAGKPFLYHQLSYLRAQGVRDVVLCVGFLGEMIQEQFGDGSRCGIRLHYSFDGPRLLGTGGAIRQALPMLGDSFFVLYGDSYLMVDYREVAEVFHHSGKPALMTVFENGNQWDTSNVWFEHGVIKAYDKRVRLPEMRHIDYGLSAYRSSVFAELPVGAVLDLADIQTTLASEGKLAGYVARHRFYEIGSQAGLTELNAFLARESLTAVSQ
ncbi:MAG TPA: nucleotidyltransferase family protein [Bryobacteraceae bacterium]|jgi:NDP-sugar pyrophosphorylase family protein|nr:nucleotidyltransferase family protein [Bryobacteraceae bacterium]